MAMRWVFIIAILIAVIPVSALAEITGPARVIDGDTLEIDGQRIRLHGIDAPEKFQTCWSRAAQGEFPCGRMAKQYLESWIESSSEVRCVERGTDRYGRVLGVCTLIGLEELELNRRMVSAGWAMAYRKYSNDYADVEDAARAREVGLWVFAFTPPWDWRKMMRGDQ